MENGIRAVARRALRGAGVVLLVAAAGGIAAGCGPSSRQRQAMMSASERAAAANAGASGTTTPVAGAGTVRGGSAGAVGQGLAPGANPAAGAVVDIATYRVAPGDLLDIKFPYHPEENQRAPVRNDGVINLPVTGDIDAAGLTVGEIQNLIIEKSSATLKGPEVSIVIAQLAEHKVFVTGQVAKPGFVPFRQGMTSLQAIVERGGFLDDAKMTDVVHLHRRGRGTETRKLDLEDAFEGTAPDVNVLAPNDIIIVPRTFIGDADVFVDQWIRGLLPTIPQPGFDFPLLFF
jgi:polysaccharide export outer membrane protein